MNTIHYKISFYSYWHAGSGLAIAAGNDMTVSRDNEGFPYIPGKTMKGLFREASENLKVLEGVTVPDGFISTVYGSSREDKNESQVKNTEGTFFSNATLPGDLKNEISNRGYKRELFDQFTSTAIDKNGVAVETSLRQMEITIPLELYGSIAFFPEKENYLEFMEKTFQWIKRLGLNRNRGFGRCQVTRIMV